LIKLPPYILFEKYIYISALEMASPGKQHCANCIGTLSFNIFLMRKQTKAQNLVDRSFNNLFFRNFVKNPPPAPISGRGSNTDQAIKAINAHRIYAAEFYNYQPLLCGTQREHSIAGQHQVLSAVQHTRTHHRLCLTAHTRTANLITVFHFAPAEVQSIAIRVSV